MTFSNYTHTHLLTNFCCSSLLVTGALLTCHDSRSSRRISARNGSKTSFFDMRAPLIVTMDSARTPCANRERERESINQNVLSGDTNIRKPLWVTITIKHAFLSQIPSHLNRHQRVV